MTTSTPGDWRDVISPDLWERIGRSLNTLLERRAALLAQIEALLADGCVAGYVVTEYRGENGPYYRLCFYTDPATRLKPNPVYIGKDTQKLERVQQQIANHHTCLQLRQQVERIELVLRTAQSQVEDLHRYLARSAETMNCTQLSFLETVSETV